MQESNSFPYFIIIPVLYCLFLLDNFCKLTKTGFFHLPLLTSADYLSQENPQTKNSKQLTVNPSGCVSSK